MDNLDRILVVDADGHVNEGEVDISSRLPEERPTTVAAEGALR